MTWRKAGLMALVVLALVGSLTMGSIRAQDFGSNWTGVFFPTTNLGGVGVTITGITAINFDWGAGPPIVNGVPVATIGSNAFSARFTGTQNIAVPGTYTFTVTSDDGVRVFINGALLLDRFVPRARTTDTFQTTLNAGPVLMVIEYFEDIDQASLSFSWSLAGAPVTPGPSPTPGPTATPAPTGLPPIPGGALTGTVIRAPVLNVRGGPSAYADRLGSVLRGQTYAIVGRDENARWFLLQLSGYQAWASGYYLFINGNEFNAPIISSYSLQGNPQQYSSVIATSVGTIRLRRTPSIYADIIGRITFGGAVAVTGRSPSGEWWRVVWKDTEGWVASSWFRIREGELSSVPVVQG
jgi:uncharacterized protein YraI